ncbi:MAG: YdeI/OmpD-associated family protein [Candidatus Baltobacteraceae bacterium]
MPVFKAKLQSANVRGTTTYVAIPESAMRAFGGRRRVPVVATIGGHRFRTTISDMGFGPCIGVRTSVREAAGVRAGDRVDVALELDLQERTVDVPEEVAAAMSVAQRRLFDDLSYSHRKEYVEWILGAKKPETRERRIRKMLARL